MPRANSRSPFTPSKVAKAVQDLSALNKPTPRFAKYYKDGTFADATIVCNGRQWKVHKLVLASRSEYFEKAFTGPFKVSAGFLVLLATFC